MVAAHTRIALFFVAAICLAEPPEANSDRRITFRLDAPKAAAVNLWGDWITRFNTTEKLSKTKDGKWEVTVGPLAPGNHSYLFIVDGLAVLDPNNANVAVGKDGAEANLIRVPGDVPLPDDERDVPHGSVHVHWYQSSVGLGQRRFLVYTPPDYGKRHGARYPILILLHGSGSTETGWTSVGSANFIADNLVAEKRMRSMLIVMPNGHQPDVNSDRFERDLLQDVIPGVESLYRVESGSQFRAIAGASMGGFQALAFGLRHPEQFSSIGVFSAGAHGAEGRKQVADAVAARRLRQIRLFWIGIGDRDPLLKDAQALDSVLEQHNITHQYVMVPNEGHSWLFWRRCLSEFLPQLFQHQQK